MSKIFKEALADAKKLKEIAEENAKKAILESVTPRIREFIEEQLLEGEEEHDSKDEIKSGASVSQTVDEGDEEQIDEATIKNLLDMIGSKELFESLSSLEEKNILIKAMKTATNKLNNTQKEKIYEISNKINQNIDKLENSKINNNIDTIQENNSMSKNEKYYEIDLKMLREAVEEEADTLEMADRYDEEDDKDLDEDLFEAIQATINFPNAEDDLLDDLEGAELMDFRVEGGDDSEEDEEESEEESEDLDIPDIEGLEDTEEPAEEGEAAMNEVFDVDPELLRQELDRKSVV